MLIRKSVLVSILACAILSAHDAKLHKGKATEGEIVSIAASTMQLKTAAGPVTVTLSAKTKYEHGDEAVTKTHLKKGDHVSVFGTKLATGELVATEVVMGAHEDDHHK
jgi:Domain of unknown function (DUF5666)